MMNTDTCNRKSNQNHLDLHLTVAKAYPDRAEKVAIGREQVLFTKLLKGISVLVSSFLIC